MELAVADFINPRRDFQMNEIHLMPDNIDATQHVSVKNCECWATLIGKDPKTGADIWQHKNLINVKPL